MEPTKIDHKVVRKEQFPLLKDLAEKQKKADEKTEPLSPEKILSFLKTKKKKPKYGKDKDLQKVQGVDEKEEIKAVNELSLNISKSLCGMMGAGMDMALKGNGHIAKQFNGDKVLERCLATELGAVASVLTNRARIAFCAGNDTVVGFSRARTLPPLIQVQEKKNEENKIDSDGNSRKKRQRKNDGASGPAPGPLEKPF